MNNNKILETIITSAIITTAGTVFGIKVNKHMNTFEEECKVNNSEHIFCWAYLNEYSKNIVLIILTFITTFLLGLILWKVFGIV